MERHSYSKVSRKVLPETMRKLYFSTKFSYLSHLVVRKVVNPLICSTCDQELISSCNNCNLIVVFHTFLKLYLIRNMIWYDSVYMTQDEVEKYLFFLWGGWGQTFFTVKLDYCRFSQPSLKFHEMVAKKQKIHIFRKSANTLLQKSLKTICPILLDCAQNGIRVPDDGFPILTFCASVYNFKTFN